MSLLDTPVDVAAPGKVAVLMGGVSAEREVSLMSGAGVLQALRSRGVDAHAFDTAQRDLGELKRDGYTRCFIALHGRHGEDGTVQGALELLGIAYTGPGVMASSMAMDKTMAKRIWRCEGLPTPDWRLVTSAAQAGQALEALGAPMIVKPAREGSTIGLSKVETAQQCGPAYRLAARYDPEVLCEQFIAGDELTCAVLDQAPGAQALPLIRIVAPDGNYDYHNKYFGTATRYHCPSGLPAEQEGALRELALQAFGALRCRGWARVDIMLRASDRQPFLLELNTAPGMTDHSLVPMAARVAGIGYADLCLRLLSMARLDTPAGALSGAARA